MGGANCIQVQYEVLSAQTKASKYPVESNRLDTQTPNDKYRLQSKSTKYLPNMCILHALTLSLIHI